MGIFTPTVNNFGITQHTAVTDRWADEFSGLLKDMEANKDKLGTEAYQRNLNDLVNEERKLSLPCILAQQGPKLEANRNTKLQAVNTKLRASRDNLAAIHAFTNLIRGQLANPKATKIDLSREDKIKVKNEVIDIKSLVEKMHQLLPNDKYLKDGNSWKTSWDRKQAEHLLIALTRTADHDVLPEIQQLTTDANRVIETFDKLFPILKQLLDQYNNHIDRINRQPK